MKNLLKLLLSVLLCGMVFDACAKIEVESWRTANGTAVMFIAAPEIPMVDVRVVFAAGSARNGSKAGLANQVNGLLGAGAGDLDANAFSAALGKTGAILGHGSLRDMAYVSIRTLSDATYAEPALNLFIDAIARPRFDAKDFERAKARTLIGLKHKKESPDDLAQDVLYASLYENHPYASPPDGTEASVAALAVEDLKRFHARYYVAQNAVIAIVGALDRAQAEKWAERISAPLAKGEKAPLVPSVEMAQGGTRQVDFSSIQSHILVGLPTVTRDDPDYFPLLVGNHVLGGNSLVSILSREIRSKRGLSYSVSSNITPMAGAGPFVAALQTDRKHEREALAVLHESIKRFIDQGPSAEELELARNNLIGGFPLRIASNDQLAEYIAMIAFYDLSTDYLTAYEEKIAAVDLAEVKAAFQRYIVPARMTTVIVGGAGNEDGS